VITEKAFGQMEQINTYTFLVHDDATKPDIIAALLYIYKVTPLSTRIVNVGKKIRLRR
jgi:ribosomal protein L23